MKLVDELFDNWWAKESQTNPYWLDSSINIGSIVEKKCRKAFRTGYEQGRLDEERER